MKGLKEIFMEGALYVVEFLEHGGRQSILRLPPAETLPSFKGVHVIFWGVFLKRVAIVSNNIF